MKSGIYGIKNIVNGKWYIGQSVNLIKRKKEHFGTLNRKTHFNRYLQRSFLEHGKNSFKFIILERIGLEKIDEREQAWIRFYKSTESKFGYNSDSGGHLNHKLTKEVRQKMSAYKKIMCSDPEWRRKMSESRKGQIITLEQRQKLSQALKGRKFSPERCKQMSKYLKGHKVSDECRKKQSQKAKARGFPKETQIKGTEAAKNRIRSEEERMRRNTILKESWKKRKELSAQ